MNEVFRARMKEKYSIELSVEWLGEEDWDPDRLHKKMPGLLLARVPDPDQGVSYLYFASLERRDEYTEYAAKNPCPWSPKQKQLNAEVRARQKTV